MDGHIHEDAARYLDVLDWRRLRVARGDLDDLLFADLTRLYGLVDGTEVVVKAAVEANLILLAGLLDNSEDFLDLLDIVVDGLLAEDVLARAQRLDGDGRVLIRGGAYQYCLDLGIAQDVVVVLCCLFDTDGLCPCLDLLVHEGICNRLHRRVLDELRDALAVDVADTAGANDTNFDHRNDHLSLSGDVFSPV